MSGIASNTDLFNKLTIMLEAAHDNWKRLKLSEDYKMSGISSNTDHVQQVDDNVRGCTWQLKKIKTIYRFHKLVFDRDGIL